MSPIGDAGPLTGEEQALFDALFAADPLTRKEQALFAAGYACSVLGRALARDPSFQRHVESIQRGTETVPDVARGYFPDAPKRRTIIAAMIELAVGEYGLLVDDRRRWLLVEQSLVNAAEPACHPDAELSPGEPRRMLQDRARAAIAQGARLIARLGAAQCLECGDQLPMQTRTSPRSQARWQRVRYCDHCEGRAGVLREAHDGLIRRVIDDVGQALGVDDAAARRRVARSSPCSQRVPGR